MDFDLSISGPSVEEVREYEIVTKEQAEDSDENLTPHQAAAVMREFGVDVAAKKTAKSAERYYRGLTPLVCWLDYERGIKNPVEATEDDISDYLKWLVNTPWARNSRKNRFAACQRFYRWAKEDGPLEKNLAETRTLRDYDLAPGELENSRRRTSEDDDYKWITRDKAVQLWQPENIPSPRVRHELLFKLMWYTCCRCQALSEVEIVEGEDDKGIVRDDGRIKVRNLKQGQSQSDYRWVYYPTDRIEPLLQQWLDQGLRAASQTARESDRLFITQQSGRMRPSYISRKIKNTAFSAGIQEVAGYDVRGDPRWMVTGHCVRHSAATWYANETDLDIHFLKNQLGHADLETTMRYVHNDPKARKRALQDAWDTR